MAVRVAEQSGCLERESLSKSDYLVMVQGVPLMQFQVNFSSHSISDEFLVMA